MPLSSWSHIKGLPRRPAIGSCMMERQRPWETFDRQTSAGTFLVFYLNGVKHLHKWEASQYIDPTKKKLSFPPPLNLVSKGKKQSSIYILNLFCTFCEICSETWTEVKGGLQKIPTYSTHRLPPQNKEKHKRPTLPDPLNTRNIFLFFNQRQPQTH